MSFVEFLGLIISFIALFVLSIKQKRETRRKREHPELYEKEMNQRQQSLKELFHSMNIELEEERPKPERRRRSWEEEDEEEEEQPQAAKPLPKRHHQQQPKAPPRMVGSQYALKYQLDRFKQVRPIDQRHLKSAIDQRRIGRQVVSQDMQSATYTDAYALVKQTTSSRALELLRSLKSPRDMVILHEILSQPKGLRGSVQDPIR